MVKAEKRPNLLVIFDLESTLTNGIAAEWASAATGVKDGQSHDVNPPTPPDVAGFARRKPTDWPGSP